MQVGGAFSGGVAHGSQPPATTWHPSGMMHGARSRSSTGDHESGANGLAHEAFCDAADE
jgi:hypothetical protein